MATYKRVNFTLVLPADLPGQDFPWESLRTLLYQGQWGRTFHDPVTGATISTATVVDHSQDGGGLAQLSLAYQGGGDELPQGQVGIPYSISFKGTGTPGPYTYSLFVGTLPLGLTLSAAGILSGTPTDAGSYAFTIRVADAAGYTHNHPYASLVILA